ncbi:MAG: polyphenol oxidase family protein [Bacteriovoracia bacterium]
MSLLFERRLSFGLFQSFDQRPEGDLKHVHQTHSSLVLPSDTPELAQQEADGIVSATHEKLAIKTADCLPIYLGTQDAKALLHAGWRGLAGGIIGHPAVAAIRPTEAFIGPSIRACCFQVTDEFAAHFPQTPLIKHSSGEWRFDLITEAYRQLHQHYPWIQATDSGICTCCDHKFPSFRRDKTTQRIWNLFSPLAQ